MYKTIKQENYLYLFALNMSTLQIDNLVVKVLCAYLPESNYYHHYYYSCDVL